MVTHRGRGCTLTEPSPQTGDERLTQQRTLSRGAQGRGAQGEPSLPARLLPLEPQYRERVWGGDRLAHGPSPIGEAWLAYGESVVAKGPLAGRKLEDLRGAFGAELVGVLVASRFPDRWPLLAKILDCADWLSIQVHPNDEQARRMEGPKESGKTEAWYFLEATPEARILMGVKRGVTAHELDTAIREGRVGEVSEEVAVQAGEAVLIPAGTLHALGPGLLLYEIQEQSDITYRAYDWGRPQSEGRKLHIAESAAVATTAGPEPLNRPAPPESGGVATALTCPYFRLELGRATAAPLPLQTGGRSFHFVTAIDAPLVLAAGGETMKLERFETALVAAMPGSYTVAGKGGPARFLRSFVPD